MSDRWNDNRNNYIPILIVIAFVLLGSGWLGWQITHGGISVETAPAGSPIYMRGCDIIKLRVNNARSPQEISVCNDGTVARSDNPPDPARWTYAQLSTEEYQNLMILRDQWCTQAPIFQSDKPDKIDYDFGVRCTDSHDVTQFRIPVNKLPSILARIEHEAPSLSPRR